jgi:Transposase DDE domain
MTSISQLCHCLQTLFTVDAVRIAAQMQLRARKFTPTTLAQTLIFGWMHNPQAGPGALANVARKLGVQVSKQSVDDHFTLATANWLLELLREAVRQVICGERAMLPLLQRFSAVLIEDGSTIALPACLRPFWKGCGGNKETHSESKAQAALKLMVRWDLLRGGLQGPYLHDGKTHELNSELRTQQMPKGSLWLADLGYFSLAWLTYLASQGVFFLIRYKEGTILWVQDKRCDILDLLPQQLGVWTEYDIFLGAKKQIKARLILQRVPPEVADQRRVRIKNAARTHQKPINPRVWALAEWTIMLTNVPITLLLPAEALSLLRARWQIELLFKVWKEGGQVDEWNTKKPIRVLCEVYAKLLALLIQHWLLICSCWQESERSMTALVATIRAEVPTLLHGFRGRLSLEQAITLVLESVAENAPIPRRSTRPSTASLLQGASFWGLT